MQSRPSPQQIAARKAEIARRYKRKAKNNRPRTIAAIRISELTRLFDHRYSRMFLPESDDALLAVRIMAHHMGALPDAARRVTSWVMTCAPWMPFAERERLISEVTECPLRWRAVKLGWKLRLTDHERVTLKIRTIAPYDLSPAELARRRKESNRQAKVRARRQKGMKARAQYLATTKGKPWIAAGISRATWYRRQPKP